MRGWSLSLLVLCVLSPLRGFGAASSETIDLKKSCRELSAEDPALHRSAREKLEMASHLPALLREALASKKTREPALCVISKLRLKELLPDLIALAERSSSTRLGSTLVKLAEPGSKDVLAPLALRWLKDPKASKNITQKFGAIEILSKLDEKIETDSLLRLISDPVQAVKLRAMDYFSAHPGLYSEAERKRVFTKALTSHPYQLRLRALAYYRSLDPATRESMHSVLKSCLKDPVEEVRSACK